MSAIIVVKEPEAPHGDVSEGKQITMHKELQTTRAFLFGGKLSMKTAEFRLSIGSFSLYSA